MKTSRASWQLKVCHFPPLLRPSSPPLSFGAARRCLRRFGVRENETEAAKNVAEGRREGMTSGKVKKKGRERAGEQEPTQPTEIIGCACALINLYTLAEQLRAHHRRPTFFPLPFFLPLLDTCVCFAMIARTHAHMPRFSLSGLNRAHGRNVLVFENVPDFRVFPLDTRASIDERVIVIFRRKGEKNWSFWNER